MFTTLPSSHPRDFLIPNAALNWLRRDADGWQIELWADTRHLQGVALDEIWSMRVDSKTMLAKTKPAKSTPWIPACAGMTLCSAPSSA